jgi:hypothetical protein
MHTRSPLFAAATAARKAAAVGVVLSPNDSSTSPGSMPAFAAGESGITSATTAAPSSSDR